MTERNTAMGKNKVLVKIVDAIYVIGILVVIYHICLAVFAGNVVPYPDVMLPATYLEIASMRLAFGAIPMLLASVLFWHCNRLGESVYRRRKQLFVFLPAAICLLCMFFYIVLFIWAMVSFVFHYGTYGMVLR